jgi:GMP synthase (glutamine-hydrolysing)
VQFHPEFDKEIMRAYIQKQAGELAEKGRDPDLLLKTIALTPDSAEILSVFGRLAIG